MTPLERRAQVSEAWARREVFAESMNEARMIEWRGRRSGFYAVGDVARIAPDMVWPRHRRRIVQLRAFAEALSP